MIRFIDLRNQGTGYRFAFFDTTTDSFVSLGGDLKGVEVFDHFHELNDFRHVITVGGPKITYGYMHEFISRLESLCPEWTKDGKEDDVVSWYES